MRGHLTVVTAAAVALWGARAGADDVTPEASLAAMIRQFQKTADDFVAARRAVVRQRQAVLDEMEEETAGAHIRAGELKALWRIAGEGDKLELYNAILAQSNATAESLADLDALVQEHRAARAKLDSAVNFRQDKLSAVAKALTVLGAEDSLEDLARYYVQFVRETKDAVDALRKEGAAAPTGSAPAAAPPAPAQPSPPAQPAPTDGH